MKKLIFVLALAILLAGGAIGLMPAPAQAQVYEYGPPPGDIYAAPWVGPNTPWVYYSGDWFLNGVLYYFFGPLYGWAPYYAYPHVYIVRPPEWYAPRWNSWYVARPQIWVHFHNVYPYWRGHTHSHRYDRRFYERHHRGAGAGWQEGFRGVKPKRVPAGPPPAPSKVAPPVGKPAPAPAPSKEPKPAPPRVTPPEGPKPSPGRVAPPEGPRPGPSRVAPSPASKPGPAAPAAPGAPAPKPEKSGPGAPKSGGPVGEK